MLREIELRSLRVLVEALTQSALERRAELDALVEVGVEVYAPSAEPDEPPVEPSSHRLENERVAVASALRAGHGDVACKPRLRGRQNVARLVQRADVQHPAHVLPAAVTPRRPAAATEREMDGPAGLEQLLADFTAGLSAPHDENAALRQPGRVAIGRGVEHECPRRHIGGRRTSRLLERPARDDDAPCHERIVGERQLERPPRRSK